MATYESAEAVILSKRLRLLLDVVSAERGSEPTFMQIATHFASRGVNLSRSRWTYMVNGHRYVKDPAAFEGLAEFFDVPVDFISGADNETPEKVIAQLDLVRSVRAAKVKSYAARTLGDISPGALRAISQYLNSDVTSFAGDGRSAVSSSAAQRRSMSTQWISSRPFLKHAKA